MDGAARLPRQTVAASAAVILFDMQFPPVKDRKFSLPMVAAGAEPA
jgi:hypothetical protein